MQEDQVLPHLAAIAILLAGAAPETGCAKRGPAQLTSPGDTAALIDQLRAGGTVLTYDPVGHTLHVGGRDALSVTIGKNR